MRHVLDDLTAYLDGALAPERRAELEGHLATCRECRAERDRLAATLTALAAAPAPPPPSPGFEARFHARLARERGGPRTLGQRLSGLRWPVLAPLAGAAALAVAGGVFVLKTWRDMRTFGETRFGSGAEKVVEIPPGTVIGYDPEEDRARFQVTESGIVVIPKGMRIEPGAAG